MEKKKATFNDLLKKKIKKEEDQLKTKDILVASMDAYLTFKTPSDSLTLDVIDDIQDGKDTAKMVKGFEKLIYQCCDQLQDPELHKELGVVDPLDTVDILFDLGEKMAIGEQLMDLVNVEGKVKVIKNS